MMIRFKQCRLEDIKGFIEAYSGSLSSPIDSYLEEHILKSQHMWILLNDIKVGYVSIFEETLLTQFYVEPAYRNLGQEIYFNVLKLKSLQAAYIPTCDEFFLSHGMDSYSSITKQAYFFKDGVKENKYSGNLKVRLANLEDITSIKENSGKFFDKLEERIPREEIYVATQDSIVVGYGIMEKGVVLKNYISVGMFTLEKYRQQGIGTSIILKLKEQVYESGKMPIAGCWYYNHNSKKTLESAGFYSCTRLLKVSY